MKLLLLRLGIAWFPNRDVRLYMTGAYGLGAKPPNDLECAYVSLGLVESVGFYFVKQGVR